MSDRLRPAEVCDRLLVALGASEGRRRRRKRDTTPDAIGLAVKRELLERAIAADPPPDAFEAWLMDRCADAADTVAAGATRAMALEVFAEWRLIDQSPAFRDWLTRGARSDDAARGPG